jgi:integrase
MIPVAEKLSRGLHPSVPYAEIPDFMVELRGREAMAAAALEFTILTAARTIETLGATWDEIDLKAGIWVIPGSRMKKGREHRVPLSGRAIELLEQTQQLGSPYLFPASKGGRMSNMAMSMLLRRMKPDATISVHGFRSSFRGWAAEATNFAWEICETALSHVTGTKTEVAYFHTDLFEKWRKMMDAWVNFCGQPAKLSDTVRPIRAAA